MADRHMPLHTERLRSCRDLLDFKNAKRARIVQMDVDIHAALLCNPENYVEMFFNVTIECRGIEAHDQIRADSNRFIQQLRRALALQDSVLRKGDELDVSHRRGETSATAWADTLPSESVVVSREHACRRNISLRH